MTREVVSDFIPWDDYYESRDNGEDKKENKEFLTSSKKKTIHHTKIDNTGTYDYLTSDIGFIPEYVEKLQDEVTKLDIRLHGIRDEIEEWEARRIQNVVTKQSKR